MIEQLTNAWSVSGNENQVRQIIRKQIEPLAGIPTGLAGVPVRYMHTPVETASLADIDRLARLLAAFVSGLDGLDLSWRD